jgi:hypothetical protein
MPSTLTICRHLVEVALWSDRHSDKARLEEIGRKFMESNSTGFTFPLTT